MSGVSRSDRASAHWPPVTIAEQELPDLADVTWLNAPFRREVTEGLSERAQRFVGPDTAGFVPLAELPAHVGAVAYLSEEIDFYESRAINRGLVQRALRLNLTEGRYVYGGSTVAQQLVKNLFLSRQKTLARKLQEIIIASRMADVVPKSRVCRVA